MNHPETILRTLDRHLVEPARLILYGRAALALGFPDPHEDFLATLDVDAILPEVDMHAIEADESFWNAVQLTNEELEPSGLYLTHLFTDSQVILQPGWLEHLVPLELAKLRLLSIFRPSVSDLVLTKMMRIDPQDRDDIQFLLSQTKPTPTQVESWLLAARVPDVQEIREAFDENAKWLRATLKERRDSV